MHQTGRLQVIDSALSSSDLTGLGIQETRWKGTGVYEGGDSDALDVIYIYSGGDEHHRGVAFALRRCYKDSIMGWWPEGDRLLRVHLRGRQDNISVVVAYAPTSDTSPENLALQGKTRRGHN